MSQPERDLALINPAGWIVSTFLIILLFEHSVSPSKLCNLTEKMISRQGSLFIGDLVMNLTNQSYHGKVLYIYR